MVMRWYRVLLIAFLAPAAFALGQTGTSLPPPPTGVETGFFRRVVLSGASQASASDWARLIYLDLANASDAAYGVKLNAGLLPRGTANASDSSMQALMDLQNAANADAVLRHKAKAWELLRAAEGGTVTSLGTAEAGLSAGQAMRQILGYDAVVLAQQDGIVDALIPDLPGQSGLYVVALGGTAATPVLKDLTVLKRTALLRLMDYRKIAGYGNVAHLQVISAEPGETLPFGTKLRLQP